MCMLPWARGGREETSEKQRTAVWEGELEQGLSNQRQPLREGEPRICTPAPPPPTLSSLLIHPKAKEKGFHGVTFLAQRGGLGLEAGELREDTQLRDQEEVRVVGACGASLGEAGLDLGPGG